MAMRVPINPGTRAPRGELGYGRAVDVTAGARMLADVVAKYADYADKENKKRELFDVQKLLVDETNNLQTDFEEKTKVEQLGAPNFVPRVNAQYATRHQQMVQNLRERGYSDDAVHEFETRLGTIRSQYVARAIDFQEKSSFAKTASDTDNLATSLSQYASNNPGAVGSALDELRVALTHSNLNEVEQLQLYEAHKEKILRGAREGFAIQHPEMVLGLYGFPDELKTVQNNVTGELVNLGQAQQTLSNQFTSAGFNPNVIAGFLGNFHVEGGYEGAKGDGGKAAGIAQWRDERRENFKKMFGKDPSEASIEDQAKFVIWEMENPAKAGMTKAQRDKILKAKTAEEAAELIDKFYERSSGKHRKERVEAATSFVSAHANATAQSLKPIPKGWKGNQEDAIQELGMTADQAAEFLKSGKDTRVAGQMQLQPADREFVEQAGIMVSPTGQTGIPILDLSSGPERAQMLVLARTIMNERTADAKAALRAEHESKFNQLLLDINDGKAGQADIDAARGSGLLADYDELKKAQDLFDAKNKKDDDLVRFHMMLSSGSKFNPYDDDAQKAADAGFEKAVKYDMEHGNQAGPFQIALRMWQRVGILPEKGGVMIRGALIGTDATQVAAAASVASNMLKQNPNAFAGVEGGEEIGLKAATYAHYVDDLGLTADEAAQRVALQNSPEFQAKVKANEPQRNAFVSEIRGDKNHAGVDIERELNDAILGKRGWGSTLTFHAFDATRGKFNEPQKAEARQTYIELATDYYDKTGDEVAARVYASRQMARFYGVEGTRLIKYPATKAYPDIMGNREYIFDQAKGLVDQFSGRDIPKEDIFLQPTATGSTAQAFRAGKAPPYEVHFITRDNDQPVYHFIPGKVFIADVEQARMDAAKKAREIEKKTRDVRKGLGMTIRGKGGG